MLLPASHRVGLEQGDSINTTLLWIWLLLAFRSSSPAACVLFLASFAASLLFALRIRCSCPAHHPYLLFFCLLFKTYQEVIVWGRCGNLCRLSAAVVNMWTREGTLKLGGRCLRLRFFRLFFWLVFFLVAETELNTKPFFVFLRWKQHLKLFNSISYLCFVASIVYQSNAELLAKLFEQTNGEMAIFVYSTCWPTERTLQSETIDQVEFSPHDNSSSGLSCLLNHKVAILETKVLSVFTINKRKDALLEPISFHISTAVHKDVLLSWMPMEIAEEKHVSTFNSFSNHHFYCEVFRIHFRTRCNPLTVEILSRKWASIVSNDDPVRVQHRDYFENKVVSQVLSPFIVAY